MQHSGKRDVVHAVIVTFHPTDALRELVDALLGQVEHVHVCDNTPSPGQQVVSGRDDARITVHAFGVNIGIAAALNEGVRSASERCSYVLMSDQDSTPLPGMVDRLIHTYESSVASGLDVAVVGPDFVNDIDETPFNFQGPPRGNPWIYHHLRPSVEMPVIEVASVVTSGSLMPIAAFERVGPFLDELFVDYVDIEWCERARSMGMACLADGRARMRHAMGHASLRYWLFRTFVISGYSPLRLYYQMRNVVFVARQPHVRRAFRVGALIFVLRKTYIYSLFSHHRLGSVGAIVRGVAHGFSGRLGPRP
jgi:rhamnosyltransferase